MTGRFSPLQKAYGVARIGDSKLRQRVIRQFARTFHLLYFASADDSLAKTDTARGSVSAQGQRDRHICIGEHDGYEIVLLDREATIIGSSELTTRHHWLILQIDLHHHSALPFIFIGTKQQSKAFYARLFTAEREARLLDPEYFIATKQFARHYTLISSPAEHTTIARLLAQPITDAMAHHHYPFAIEIHDDRLLVITDADRPTAALLTKMLHYGLWLARHIDNVT